VGLFIFAFTIDTSNVVAVISILRPAFDYPWKPLSPYTAFMNKVLLFFLDGCLLVILRILFWNAPLW